MADGLQRPCVPLDRTIVTTVPSECNGCRVRWGQTPPLAVRPAQFLGDSGDARVDAVECLPQHPQSGFEQGGFGRQHDADGGLERLVGVKGHLERLVGVKEHAVLPRPVLSGGPGRPPSPD
ncbi:hypothetical protein SCOCK_150029 [Actinacidiphila cocklensis]|uniref:Uncharacterized protein n=1 Tax=Actinacidiphila cocklensis TaxID=887465 RepID=A0A9W4E3H4_9ACTN|nr:hypothetical protein SCOCK_150029 [Actinacidiphila cocklensis]